MNVFEVLKSIDSHVAMDADSFLCRYFDFYEMFGNPSETLTYFDYDGRYILHKWNTKYGAEYLWVIQNSSGNLSYHAGSGQSNKV